MDKSARLHTSFAITLVERESLALRVLRRWPRGTNLGKQRVDASDEGLAVRQFSVIMRECNTCLPMDGARPEDHAVNFIGRVPVWRHFSIFHFFEVGGDCFEVTLSEKVIFY